MTTFVCAVVLRRFRPPVFSGGVGGGGWGDSWDGLKDSLVSVGIFHLTSS